MKIDKIFKSVIIKISIVVFFSTLSFVINFINLKFIHKSLISFNSTIKSPDDSFYTPQIKNLLSGKGFTTDPNNLGMQVRRTPGYSIIYGLHYYLLGEKNAHYIIRITQCVLFGISVLLLGLSISIFIDIKHALISILIYGFSPFVMGYNFYTITESIHPEFIVFTFYLLSLSIKYPEKKIFYIGTGFFSSCSFLIRPTNGIILIPILILYYIYNHNKNSNYLFKLISHFTIGLFSIWSIWIIRNFLVTNGEIILLEKYYTAPMPYGKLQVALSKWWMCWDNPHPEELLNGIEFDLYKKNNMETIDKFISSMPEYSFSGSSRNEVRKALISIQTSYKYQFDHGLNLIIYKPNQKILLLDQIAFENFSKLEDKFKENNPLRAYFISPWLVRGKEFIFHSFSSMYHSLNTPNLNLKQKGIKAIMYLLNLVLFIGYFFVLIINIGKYKINILIILFPLLLFTAHIYMAHIEGRYLIAAYPFFAICTSEMFVFLYEKLLLHNKINGNEVL